MASRCCALVLCVAVLAATRTAHAQPRVVIVETRDAPTLSGLATQVQLHAGRPVTVSTLDDRDEASTTFAARAAQIVAEQDATIVVWIAVVQDDPSRRTFLVSAAGRWPGRALIELVQFDVDTPLSDVERTVALKIAGLFALIVAPRPMAAALGVPASAIEPAAWRVEINGSLVGELGDRRFDARVGAELDRRWPLTSWILTGVGVHWQPSGTIAAEPGLVSIDEVGLDLAIGLERKVGSWTLFGRPRASALLLYAEGTSRHGPTGSAVVLSPTAGCDIGARWALSDMIELALSIGIDAAFIQHRFLVDATLAADLRRVRGWATLGISIPLR